MIFVVYWQFPHFGDPSGEKSILHNFYSGVGGSSWLNTDTQYYGPVGTFISNPSGQLAGEWVDTANPIPLTVTASSIASEALRAEAHFGYSFNAAYVIATPHGDSMNGFGTVWCGWHASESSSSGSVAFTNVPYITDAASCGANFNNLGPKAGITIVSGHEEAETQTDPNPPYGWTDNNGAEIGDKCEWIKTGHRGAARTITLSTGTFAVQSLWDNAFNGDSGGCVISGP